MDFLKCCQLDIFIIVIGKLIIMRIIHFEKLARNCVLPELFGPSPATAGKYYRFAFFHHLNNL